MAYLLVRHKVADFAKWKRIFDSHAEAQRAAGLRLEQLLRNMDDPNEVVFWFKVDDLAKARSFVSTAAAAEAAGESGVADRPDLYFLA